MAIKTRETTADGVTNNNAPLTNAELDNNFIELQQNKADLSGADFTGDIGVTGTVTADGLIVGDDQKINLGGGANSYDDLFRDTTGNATIIRARNDVRVNIDANSDSTTAATFVVGYDGLDTTTKKALEVKEGGDISFYEDTGTTAKFIWSSANQTVQITNDNSTAYDGTNFSTSLGGLVIQNTDTTSGTGSFLRFVSQANGTGQSVIGSVNGSTAKDSELVFLTRDGAATDDPIIERMRITSTGDVGIGTASPSYPLHVEVSDNDYIAYINNTGTSGADALRLNTAGTGTGTRILDVQSAGATHFLVRGDGRVGIGTDSPAAQLHLEGSSPIIQLEDTDASGAYSQINGNGTGGRILISADAGNTAASSSIEFAVDGSEAMRIDSNGTLGVGVVPETDWYDGTWDVIQLGDNSSLVGIKDGVSTINRTMLSANAKVTTNNVTSGWNRINALPASQLIMQDDDIIFRQAATGTAGSAITWSEAMRINSSGNLLVGTTDTTVYNNGAGTAADNGFQVSPNGWMAVTGYAQIPAFINRTSTDGGLVRFLKDGTEIGSIGTDEGTLYIGRNDTGVIFEGFAADTIVPYNPSTNTIRDNAINLGYSSSRFKDLYLSGGVYFGGTGSANYLDDYEEGVWYPSSSVVTLNTSYGYYVKIGKMVTIIGHISFPTSSSGTGVNITGIPFTADDNILGGQAYKSGGGLGYSTKDFPNGAGFSIYTDTSVNIRDGNAAYTYADLSGDSVRFQITYYAA